MADMNSILIIGGTSGLGEGFARRFHSMGNKVIITGRRQERYTSQWDLQKLDALNEHASNLLNAHPDIDTIILMAGTVNSFSYFANSSTEHASIEATIAGEITTNLTAPAILFRTLIPFLSHRAASGKKANLIVVTSALAYIPLGYVPVYCSTKSALHTLCLCLRQQLATSSDSLIKENLSICELSPPAVATDLNPGVSTEDVMVGKEEPEIWPVDEYLDRTMESFEKRVDGKMMKEIATPGFAELGVRTWRDSFGKVMEKMGIET